MRKEGSLVHPTDRKGFFTSSDSVQNDEKEAILFLTYDRHQTPP